MSFRLSRRAEEDLEGLYWIGATAFGLVHADEYFAGLIKAIEFVGSFPRAVRERAELG